MKKFHLILVLLAYLHSVAQAQVPDAVDSVPPIPAQPEIGATSYIVMDYNSGRVLVECNPDLRVDPASITKVMTAYVVFSELTKSKITLEQTVPVSEAAWRAEGSRMFIDPTMQVSVQDLLRGMVIQSGNDASIKGIGYTKSEYGIEWETCSLWVQITEQSPDISQGVTVGKGLHKEQGAGDQGMMYGYASNETKEFMPLPILLAHKLTKRLSEMRKTNRISYLRPDGKSQVSIEYDEKGKPLRAHTIVVSTQHDGGVAHDRIRKDVIDTVIKPVCAEWIDKDTIFHVNPTGAFVRGGPYADAGLTG